MAVSNNDILRISIVWKYRLLDEQVNVYHVKITTPAANYGDFQDDVKEWAGNLYSDVIAAMSQEVVHNRFEVFNETTGNPELPIGDEASLDGTNTADALASQTAALVFGRTGYSRRISRKFLPTFTDTTLVNGVWDTGTTPLLANMAGKLADLYPATNGTGFNIGVYNPTDGFVSVVQGAYSVVPVTQRRRRLGRGV